MRVDVVGVVLSCGCFGSCLGSVRVCAANSDRHSFRTKFGFSAPDLEAAPFVDAMSWMKPTYVGFGLACLLFGSSSDAQAFLWIYRATDQHGSGRAPKVRLVSIFY